MNLKNFFQQKKKIKGGSLNNPTVNSKISRRLTNENLYRQTFLPKNHPIYYAEENVKREKEGVGWGGEGEEEGERIENHKVIDG